MWAVLSKLEEKSMTLGVWEEVGWGPGNVKQRLLSLFGDAEYSKPRNG